jgi:hypothetical protein
VSVKIPAVAASLLLAGTIGVNSAHAARAYTNPPEVIGNAVVASGIVTAGPGDSCYVAWHMRVFGGQAGDPILPIVSGRTQSANLCTSPYATRWEDGSISIPVSGVIASRALLRPHHRYLIGVTTCSAVRGIVGCHQNFRSFWGS